MPQRDRHPIQQARLTKRQTERHRANIRVGNILERLQRCIDPLPDQEPLQLRPDQLTAAKLLLDKSIPSLTATAVSEEPPPEVLMSEAEIVASLAKRLEKDMPNVRELLLERLKSPPEAPSVGNVVLIDGQVVDG